MLELDLVLDSFLRRHLPDLGEEQLERLAELLERADPELWDIVSGRSERYDPRQSGIVSLLRTESAT